MATQSDPPQIDFNCDMGESFGAYTLGLDGEVIRHVTSANIACGFHAGDPGWMRATVRLAEEHGVGIGAHPGFPDLRGFGRRNLAATPAEIRDDLVYQIGALTAFTREKRLQHVKPHGALYNMAVDRDDVGAAIADAVLAVDERLILVVLAGSRWEAAARRAGVRVAREVFADRAFRADGSLVPRREAGAVIHDRSTVIERSLQMVTAGVATAITGETIERRADTICLHGDTPGAVELAAALRAAFERAGVQVVPMATLIAR
jgi:5-oxoprolinase (ATP-hydrolysing) subunit A